MIKVTRGMAEAAVRNMDWTAIDAITDEDIESQVADNPDAAPILDAAQTAAALVRTVRERLGISQTAFAARYGIAPVTLRDWEQGRKAPDRTAMSYLKVIAKEPDLVAKALTAA
jgi:putative transcriptional regulator